MKKLLIIGGTLVGLCLVALVVASFFLGSIVKAGVNDYGPKITRTKVSLAGASISPLSGNGSLRGLQVGNPTGWSDADLASLGSIHVSVVPKSLFADHVVINDIDIDAPAFDYETKLSSSNVGDLLANIEQNSGSSAATAKSKSGAPLKFEVRHFRVRNGQVRLGAGAAAVSVPLPPLELSNVGTAEGGITSAQLATTVMRALSRNILSAGAKAAQQAAEKAAQNQAVDAAKNQLNKAADKVKGLLGPKKP
jgi:uncharacterized protein involved in outer membrane biogenesis